MLEFCKRLGLETYLQEPGRFIHVAGTNGKGSVTAFVQSLLLEQGWPTGACYSPYVYSVRERVQFRDPAQSVTSNLVSEEDFARLVEEIWPIAEALEGTELDGPTEFEFKTAMGFMHWQQKGAKAVALEVGLGGRLDATNVITQPACSVITNIGLDHTQLLGSTLAEIAIEKAGIIKPGQPVVIGELPEEALHAVETIAKVNAAAVWRYGREFVLSTGLDGYQVTTPKGTYQRLNPGLKGVNQPHNMAVAIAACDVAELIQDQRKVMHGVAKASAPGRMQTVTYQGRRFLLDGAHNHDAAVALAQSCQGMGSICLLTGMLEGHIAGEFYDPLSQLADEVHFVPIQFHRARNPRDLDQESGFLFRRAVVHETVANGIKACLESAADLIVVTGSFYLVGEVGRIIGGA